MSPLFAHALHACAWSALRFVGARRSLALLKKITPTVNHLEARHVANMLEPWGTCLSRSITVAALIPRSTVVFGVDVERVSHVGSTKMSLEARPRRAPERALRAHAWVELDGLPLRSWDVMGTRLAEMPSKDVVIT